MKRYRYSTLFAAKVGEWRDTREEALEDARAADLAEPDDADHIELDLGVFIDECEAGHEPQGLTDWELWACAVHTLQMHGSEAPRVVAERIVELAKKADVAGIQAWRAIGERLDRLDPDRRALQ